MAGDVAASSAKTTWFILFGAMSFAVLMYGLVGFFVMQSRTAVPTASSSPSALSSILYVLAGAALVASIVWVHLRTSGKIGDAPVTGTLGASGGLMPPSQFQTDTIVGLALGEACALLGFVLFLMGAPITEFARFAAGTLAVYLFYILPKGIRYWTAWEARQKLEQQASDGPFSQSL